MKSRAFLGMGVLFAMSLFFTTFVAAEPRYIEVVNHSTKQCMFMYVGDECETCSLPKGWEILYYGIRDHHFEDCPSGYSRPETIGSGSIAPGACNPIKNTFCCSTPHTGARDGDCSDVVINHAAKRCAFVEDINDCPSLPKGWEKHGRLCPFGYKWVDEGIECLNAESSGVVENTSSSSRNNALIVGAILLALFLVVLVTLLGTRWKRRSNCR